jgi:hypothetical protein
MAFSPRIPGIRVLLAAFITVQCQLAPGAGAQESAGTGRLSVTVLDDATGSPTAFRARLVHQSGAVAPLPAQAVAVMYGEQDQAQGYAFQPDSAFYVDGDFAVELPTGRYRLTLSKGHEYVQQTHELEVRGGETLARELRLMRWIDMPARGWFSVDDHVHLRRSPRENPLILTWLAAEDIHVGALLQMGDFNATYFAQYAWGNDGVYHIEDRFIASGQEDPRTHELGHTISLGAEEFVRSRRQYYYYDRTFDRVHELGGLTGYAHQGVLFHGYRGLTLDVLGGKVDFMEILQFCSDVEPPLHTEHYYHFLDLGFRLTATAGSDFPWCGRENGPQIGNVRFYAHIDGELGFQSWKESIRAGHTFVSSGPMLELTVDGRLPGDQLSVSPGSRVTVSARASGHAGQVPLRDLEIVVHGQVVGRIAAGDAPGQDATTLALELDLPVERGFWVAARASAGADQFAHTTPVYVTVGDGFHNPATLQMRLDRTEGYLAEIEAEISAPSLEVDSDAWRFACAGDGPGCFGDDLRARIADTRRVIAELRARQ